ncbi:MAG: hypothetical protein K0S01_1933 [Herbinix sp.]|jgi:hypothetical protein|nr:hypothetical protein [Herbinix sp.]
MIIIRERINIFHIKEGIRCCCESHRMETINDNKDEISERKK